MDLRRDGKSYAEIAAELGYSSVGSASKDVSRALDEVVQESGEALIRLELARTEALLLRALELSGSDDMKAVKAVDVATRVLARRAKMLGLDMTYTEAHSKRTQDETDHSNSLIGSLFNQAREYMRDKYGDDDDAYEQRWGAGAASYMAPLTATEEVEDPDYNNPDKE